MDKEEPNFNVEGGISDSESVLEAKGRAKIRKTTRKTSLRVVIFRGTSQETKTRCFVKNKSITIFHDLHSFIK